MTRIVTTIDIARPIAEVFDYATTPGNWPAWHPSSLGVTGAAGRSLAPGEQLEEEFVVAGRHGRARWTVRERRTPTRWVIEGRAANGGGATVTYTLTPHDGGTRFERELAYTMPSIWWAILDWLTIRRRVAAESAEALRRLKAVLEGRDR